MFCCTIEQAIMLSLAYLDGPKTCDACVQIHIVETKFSSKFTYRRPIQSEKVGGTSDPKKAAAYRSKLDSSSLPARPEPCP